MIYNFLSQLKNAALAKNGYFEAPFSTFSEGVCRLLKKTGFVSDYKVFKESGETRKGLRVDLSYDTEGVSKVKDIKIMSRPGLRVYSKAKRIFPVRGGRGIAIISTSQGIMEGRDAKKKSLGGEVIAFVY